MANIWRKDDNVKEQPKRNIMDLSFQNNLTTQFGKLVPVFCKEFIPGDSFSIQPTFSLKFQPMVFPIQTRMRAHLHFFKVRNRNLWKDWEDFIAKNKENLDPPYLDTAVTKPTTGSLLDYLGVPTTISGNYGNVVYEGSYTPETRVNYVVDDVTVNILGSYQSAPISLDTVFVNLRNKLGQSISFSRAASPSNTQFSAFPVEFTGADDGSPISITLNHPSAYRLHEESYTSGSFTYDFHSPIPRENANIAGVSFILEVSSGGILTNIYSLSNKIETISSFDSSKTYYFITPVQWNLIYTKLNGGSATGESVTVYNSSEIDYSFNYSVGRSQVVDIDDSTSPYWRSGSTSDSRERIKLSALPCRAYEQIYNSFYRNAENNPYILNGVPEYNKYMPTDEGGVDANLYDFYYRNWEDDFLTTALQQPQAGIAPLVGLTGTAGTATVTLADEDGNTSEATASYDEEGNVTSVAFANSTSLTEALADAVQYGISINDLRNVNAFQRWLEAKARGGYKYRDVIETMFGISVRYDTLDMPEFIGGTSIDIFVNQISQTVPTETSPLGDYAGQASGVGTGQTINEYFDEHGFVIGILSVVPVPNYSQLLPKYFIKRDAFDYYFPQFGHIGMQPIKYDEVCPVQSYQESTDQSNVLDETFGYQRAWYDYLASTDEVHGEFRTNLRNFVMNRTFDVKPELVKEFLTVDPSQLNDVFAIQDDSYDKILGQIYFDVKAKRPIPLYGIPKLE